MPNFPDFDLIETHVMQAVKGNAFAEEVGRALVRDARKQFDFPGGYDELLDTGVNVIASVGNPAMISYPTVQFMVKSAFGGVPKARALLASLRSWGEDNGLRLAMQELKDDVRMLATVVCNSLMIRIAEAVKNALEEQSMLELLDEEVEG